MPTFNRNDTAGILALYGQTPSRGSTQPRDEEYYTSNTPARPTRAPVRTAPPVAPIQSSSRSPTVSIQNTAPVRVGPQPPTTMGPAVGPPGVLRNELGAIAQYTDALRQNLAKTPVRYTNSLQDDPPYAGAYYAGGSRPGQGTIDINARYNAPTDTLRHEFAHKQWDEQGWGYGENPNGFVQETMGLANDPRFPTITRAWSDWVSSQAHPLYRGESSPAELHGRIAEFGYGGGGMPQGYRDRYFPNTYTTQPMGEGPIDYPTYGYQTPFGFQPWYQFEDGSWGR